MLVVCCLCIDLTTCTRRVICSPPALEDVDPPFSSLPVKTTHPVLRATPTVSATTMPPKSGLAAKVASRLAASNNSGPSTGRRAQTKPPPSKPAQPTPPAAGVTPYPAAAGPTAELPTFRDEPPQLDVPLVDVPAVLEPGPEQLAAASEQTPPGRLERQYSIASQKTVGLLDQIKFDLVDLQQRLSRAEAEIEAPQPADGLPAALRGELAKLHGDANKLLATRIDAILTGAYVQALNHPLLLPTCDARVAHASRTRAMHRRPYLGQGRRTCDAQGDDSDCRGFDRDGGGSGQTVRCARSGEGHCILA